MATKGEIAAGVAFVVLSTWLFARQRKAAAAAKKTVSIKKAQPGGVAPPEAPDPEPVPEAPPPEPTVAEKMTLLGMTVNPVTFVAGVEDYEYKAGCRIVHYGAIPSLLRFDPFEATKEYTDKIILSVLTTMTFLNTNGDFVGCHKRTTNIQLSKFHNSLGVDIQKNNAPEACPGFATGSTYTIKPFFEPVKEVSTGLLSVRGTLKFSSVPCDLAFVNVTMVPTVKSIDY